MIPNPLDWPAVPFLLLYGTLAVVCLAIIALMRNAIGAADASSAVLTPFELAYLAGGPVRVGDAALFTLVDRAGGSISPDGRKIEVRDPSVVAGGGSTLIPGRTVNRNQFQKAIRPFVEAIRLRLIDLGLAPSDEQMSSLRSRAALILLVLVGFGVAKVLVGASRNHPVGILIGCLVATVFLAFALLARPSRTRAGKAVLQRYRETHARAARAPVGSEFALAIALSGAVVLSGTDYHAVYAASKHAQDGGSGSDSGGGDGGGGCGGCSS